jgi:hypothetical protein
MGGLSRSAVIIGVIGLALLIFQSVQAMRGVVIGTLGTTILFVGLGLIVVAAVLIALAVSTDSASTDPVSTDSVSTESGADVATESVLG